MYVTLKLPGTNALRKTGFCSFLYTRNKKLSALKKCNSCQVSTGPGAAADLSARNASVQTASLQCFSITPEIETFCTLLNFKLITPVSTSEHKNRQESVIRKTKKQD